MQEYRYMRGHLMRPRRSGFEGGDALRPHVETPLVAVWQPLKEQLEVYGVDRDGAIKGVWKQLDEG